MAEAMVTARMAPEKKEMVNRELERLGSNASQAINRLYDFILREGRLPFEDAHEVKSLDAESIAQARAWVDSIERLPEGNVFQNASDDDIRAMRLMDRGLLDGWGGYEE